MAVDDAPRAPGPRLAVRPAVPSAFAHHDHAACVTDALAAAEAGCGRLTPVRRRTLEILLESHAAVGAYEILARLAAEGLGSQPPVAYRALNFLVAHGLAHRIEGLNAFVACARPGAAHAPAFLVCRACRAVAESEAPEAVPEADGFSVERRVIETEGVCAACRGLA